MASPRRQPDSVLRLAVRPAPLAVLAVSGVAAALGGWAGAIGGAVAYLATVGAISLRRQSGPFETPFAPPNDVRLPLKSREILALSMRIRKAHRALYEALLRADGNVRSMLVDSYQRIEQLVAGTDELATRADNLQLHIDTVRAKGAAPPELDVIVKQREAATAELTRVAEAIEAVPPRLLAGSTIDLDDATQVASELAGELQHMRELIDEVALK